MKTILAVDAGGTKTHAALLDEQNHILSTADTGAGNPTLDYTAAVANIAKAIADCMPMAQDGVQAIVVGAAGAGACEEALKADLQARFPIPVWVTTDGILATYGALEDRDGLLLISGTGSLIQGKKQGVLSRMGGWGHLLGEYGSGAAIGYRLLTALAEAIDLDKPVPALQEAVFATLGVSDRYAMTAYVYSHPKSDIARLAPVADRLAQAGDIHAKAVLMTEAHTLAGHTANLYQKLGFTTEEIHVTGGCITHLTWFREQFAAFVTEMLPTATLCPEPVTAELGAWAYWRACMEREGR